MDSLIFEGTWWLPHLPDVRVGGILRFNQPDFPELSLYGAFEPILSSSDNNYEPIILGAASGKSITLVGCYRNRTSFSWNGSESSGFVANRVLVGGWIEQESDLQFDKIRFEPTYLADWIGLSGLNVNFPFGDTSRFSIEYRAPELIEIYNDSAQLEIIFGVESTFAGRGRKVSETTLVRYRSSEPKSIHTLLDSVVLPTQFLLNLFTTKPNFIESCFLTRNALPHETFKLYYPQQNYTPRNPGLLKNHQMLFSYSDIQGNIGAIFDRWDTISNDLRDVLSIFRRVQLSPQLFLELKFLSITQALETFHRRTQSGGVLPKELHKRRIDHIVTSVSAEHREWIKSALAFSNEKTQIQRLDELLSLASPVMSLIVDDMTEFAKRVRNTRNYLTHFDDRLRLKAVKGSDLYWMTEHLIVLLQSSLLAILGFDIASQVPMFLRNGNFQHLRDVGSRFGSQSA